MNKKGTHSIRIMTFILASMIVSIIIILFFTKAVPNMLLGSVEEVMAKDIGLSVMTISASPYDIIYFYEKNTESYSIRLTKNQIQIKSDEASGTYNYLPVTGINIQESIAEEILSIPISMNSKTLSFSDEQDDFSDFCAMIPENLGEKYLDVKIIINSELETESVQKLQTIKKGIELQESLKPGNIRFTNYDEDLTLKLSESTTDQIIIKYYKDGSQEGEEWINRIACYISKNIEDENTELLGKIKLQPHSTEKTIEIELIKSQDSKDKIFPERIVQEIYSALEFGNT